MAVDAMTSTIWQVIGGRPKIGILVRKDRDFDSEKLAQRLSQGALVSEIELVNGRLHYQLIAGEGPESGWVSLEVSGKELVAKASESAVRKAQEIASQHSLAQQIESQEIAFQDALAQQIESQRVLHIAQEVEKAESISEHKCKENFTQEVEKNENISMDEWLAREAQKEAERLRLKARTTKKMHKQSQKQVLEDDDIVEVIDNEQKGGLPVWSEQAKTANKTGTLSSGTLIRIKHQSDNRIFYEKLQGTGPDNGWVDIRIEGVPMLVKKCLDPTQFSKVDPNTSSYAIDADVNGSSLDDQAITEDTKLQGIELLKVYAKHFGQSKEINMGNNRTSFNWALRAGCQPAWHNEVLAQLQQDLEAGASGTTKKTAVGLRTDVAVDSDGEPVQLCSHCNLPVGDLAYTCQDKASSLMHAECMAQHVLQKLQNDECAALCKARATKQKHRAEYEIGWKVTHIPRNVGPATKLKCSSAPAGMCCLVWDASKNMVRVAATLEPAASINLEYLSLALQVRKRTGHEPWFSLDPVTPGKSDSMQKKIFDPEWLQGTSLGEVMFQADYHLKELSMGEYDQPVVGMKSCFDYDAEVQNSKEKKEWNAREWFVVNKCEVQLSDDDVVIPYVKMGVQAREQKLNAKTNRMDDIPVTSRSHPLAQYAEQFTRFFDLIAERKSVISQLREVAKATVVAKFLMDSRVRLEAGWYSLNEEVKPGSCVMELPQLWNMRGSSQIQVKDGKIVDAHKGFATSVHSIYGGVEFGVDKFRLATPAMSRAYPSAGGVPTLRAAPLSAMPAAGVHAKTIQMGRPMPTSTSFARPAASLSTSLARPQGVDLNLNKFDLSAPTRLTGQMRACSTSLESPEARVAIGNTFVEEIKNGFTGSIFDDKHRGLLKKIFNPNLCDRQHEGSVFVLPDTRPEHVSRLEQLVKEEDGALSRRVERFVSRDFKMEAPGREFPPSWTSAYELSRGEGETTLRESFGSVQPTQLEPAPDYKAHSWVFEQFVLKTATPIFDKTTEEGARFRIYRLGSIEVRTLQADEAEEKVVNVWSIRSSNHANPSMKSDQVADDEKIVKITHFVERIPTDTSRTEDKTIPGHRFYVVVETAAGNVIVTEKLDDTVTFQINPKDVEDRNSLAKTICSEDCADRSISVLDLKHLQAQQHVATRRASLYETHTVKPLTGKKYVERVMEKVLGDKEQRRKALQKQLTPPEKLLVSTAIGR